jgi:hypothetical protein
MKFYKSLSYSAILLIGIICTWIILNRELYKREDSKGLITGVIIHDINYYYSYLPANFIEHDLSLKFLNDTSRNFAGRYWHLDAPNGGHVFKMSMGMSYLYSPFFFAGHLAAVIKNKPTDGFSKPYQFFMSFCGLFYMLCGLWFLRKVLLTYFSEFVTAATLVVLGMGTNLFFYSVQEGPMTHAPNFFLFGLVLSLTIKWHKEASWTQSILLGLAIGVASLIRPTNIIIAFIPFFYNVYSFHSMKGKWQWALSNYYKIIVIGICILLPWIPQLLYWKMVTGQWFFYSYINESFFFSNPHILETLFSFRKGLFIYTPLMLVAFAGLFILRKRLPQFSSALWLFTAANIYIISSWWCWWYGGSFGLRAYIEMFALWSIPLAIVIEKIVSYNKLIRRGALSFLFLFVLLNIFQSMQYWNGALHWDGMNYKLYKAQFLHRSCVPNYDELVTQPDYQKAMKGEKEYYWN